MVIIKNEIQCNICHDIIQSRDTHEFKRCKCGACAVDGGHQYLRRCYRYEGCYTERSVTRDENEKISDTSLL